jgi:replicative DNA helicase
MSEINKIQPQAIDLERAVLGAILLERDAIDTASTLISSEDFYDINAFLNHVWIFEIKTNL